MITRADFEAIRAYVAELTDAMHTQIVICLENGLDLRTNPALCHLRELHTQAWNGYEAIALRIPGANTGNVNFS